MAGPNVVSEMPKGTRLAIGILLIWFGGFGLYVAFMSGKVPSLTTGKLVGKDGKPVKGADGKQLGAGPKNLSELLVRTSANFQALQGGDTGTSGGDETTVEA